MASPCKVYIIISDLLFLFCFQLIGWSVLTASDPLMNVTTETHTTCYMTVPYSQGWCSVWKHY